MKARKKKQEEKCGNCQHWTRDETEHVVGTCPNQEGMSAEWHTGCPHHKPKSERRIQMNAYEQIKEALERLLTWVDEHTGIYSIRVSSVKEDPEAVQKEMEEIKAQARAALAEPPMNCNLYSNWHDAWFKGFCKTRLDYPSFGSWLFELAEKGGAK